MRITIELPEKTYEEVMNGLLSTEGKREIRKAIQNGTREVRKGSYIPLWNRDVHRLLYEQIQEPIIEANNAESEDVK